MKSRDTCIGLYRWDSLRFNCLSVSPVPSSVPGGCTEVERDSVWRGTRRSLLRREAPRKFRRPRHVIFVKYFFV